jgi:ankyrin repeat protein
MRANFIEYLLPPMSRQTKSAMAILALGLAAMALVPYSDPIPTSAEQLHAAAIHGDMELAERALHQGAAADTRDNVGMTPLIEAARAGHLEICKRLLRNGANINAITPVYGTALMQAAFCGHVDVVNFLLRSGADPNLRNGLGIDALRYAVMGEHEDTAAELRIAIHPPCRF